MSECVYLCVSVRACPLSYITSGRTRTGGRGAGEGRRGRHVKVMMMNGVVTAALVKIWAPRPHTWAPAAA